MQFWTDVVSLNRHSRPYHVDAACADMPNDTCRLRSDGAERVANDVQAVLSEMLCHCVRMLNDDNAANFPPP